MTWLARAVVLGLLVFVVFGPLANLALWAAAEQWYFPHKLPVSYGTKFWAQVFKPRGEAKAAATGMFLRTSDVSRDAFRDKRQHSHFPQMRQHPAHLLCEAG